MNPTQYNFGGGASETMLHPIVLGLLIIVAVALVFLRQRYALPAFLFGTFLIPGGQQVVIGGVHVYVYRFVVLAGLLRLIRFRRSPLIAGKWNFVDTVFSLSILCHAVAFTLLYQQTSAAVNQVGYIWDYLGAYIFLRYAVRDKDDILYAIKCFVVLVTIFAFVMIREQFTGYNLFGYLGGVLEKSEVREGHVRSEAVFQHAILAGVFGAILLPLFVSLWKCARSRILASAGIVASAVMMITTFCSTPLLAYLAGASALGLWPFRRWLRPFLWSALFALLGLQVVMKAPIWALIDRIHVISGSSSYHRFELVDLFISHFGDWWLLGTASNGQWGYQTIDTSNEYVHQGVTGGIFALVFFLLVIVGSFRRIGRGMRRALSKDLSTRWLLWCLGSSLFVNVMAYLGISYFDQTRVAWLTLLAMICAATSIRPQSRCQEPASTHQTSFLAQELVHASSDTDSIRGS